MYWNSLFIVIPCYCLTIYINTQCLPLTQLPLLFLLLPTSPTHPHSPKQSINLYQKTPNSSQTCWSRCPYQTNNTTKMPQLQKPPLPPRQTRSQTRALAAPVVFYVLPTPVLARAPERFVHCEYSHHPVSNTSL